jgi:hypothetical protein
MGTNDFNSTSQYSQQCVDEREISHTLMTEETSVTQAVGYSKVETVRQAKEYSTRFIILSAIVLTCIGLIVFTATGLYDVIDSEIGRIISGGLIVYYFLQMFREGLY